MSTKLIPPPITPGPWEPPFLWDDSGVTNNNVSHAPLPGQNWKADTPTICSFPEKIENRANARFIAAAPQMAEALLDLLDAHKDERNNAWCRASHTAAIEALLAAGYTETTDDL